MCVDDTTLYFNLEDIDSVNMNDWLPVTKWCQNKLLVLTYKTLHGTTPTHIR